MLLNNAFCILKSRFCCHAGNMQSQYGIHDYAYPVNGGSVTLHVMCNKWIRISKHVQFRKGVVIMIPVFTGKKRGGGGGGGGGQTSV